MIFQINYLSEGLKVKAYVAIPNDIDIASETFASKELPAHVLTHSIVQHKKDVSSCLLPAILYCRGGIGNYGRVKLEWIEEFASHGYIVFAPCYRGNEGGEGRDEFGGADVADTIAAYHLLADLPFVDKQRISLLGFSRGAINAVKAVIEIPNVAALILWGGVSDLAKTYDERIDLRKMLKRVIGGTPRRATTAFDQRSPITFAKNIHCPVLLMHGTLDNQVPYSHAYDMHVALRRAGKLADIHSYEGFGHHLPLSVHSEAVARMMCWITKNT